MATTMATTMTDAQSWRARAAQRRYLLAVAIAEIDARAALNLRALMGPYRHASWDPSAIVAALELQADAAWRAADRAWRLASAGK